MIKHTPGKTLKFKPGDRLFSSMWQVVQLLAGQSISQVSTVSGGYVPDFIIGFHSARRKTCLLVNVTHVIPLTMENLVPELLEVRVAMPPGLKKELRKGYGSKKLQWDNLHTLCAAIIFVNFYENYTEFFEHEWKNNMEAWPRVIAFAKVIRNAISHSGTLRFRSSNSPSVTWRGLTYSPADHGKKVFDGDMSAADIIFLMLEMGDALDAVGAPIEI